MSSPKTEVEYVRHGSLAEAIAHVREVLDALESGAVEVEGGQGALTLTPSGPVRLKVEGEQEPHEEELSIKLEWRRGGEARPAGPGGGVRPAGDGA